MNPTPEQNTITPPGRVEIGGEQATLHFERTYPHPIEAVWAAITEPEQLAAWYMAKATIEGREGGKVDMVTGTAQFHWTGEVLTWNPPHVFEYTFNMGPGQFIPNGEQSIVRYELEAAGNETKLKLTHSRLTRGTALGFAPGTHAYLDRLASQLAGQPLVNWMERYEQVKHAYPSWTPNT